ncbi:hypothetical protein ARAF_2029 [Arsenophonus endosymbiont of Aleurodicus floccissimus]|nr:hypothetical protein ARAF_2029 [Arsenophonus endosymbiont of Aleurodicus floccissimus]
MVADLRGKRHTPAVDVVMLKIICTNRDMPQKLSNGNSEGDFDAEFALPGVKVIALIRPQPPLRPQLDAAQNWRMVAQFNLNHMLLCHRMKVGSGYEKRLNYIIYRMIWPYRA